MPSPTNVGRLEIPIAWYVRLCLACSYFRTYYLFLVRGAAVFFFFFRLWRIYLLFFFFNFFIKKKKDLIVSSLPRVFLLPVRVPQESLYGN